MDGHWVRPQKVAPLPNFPEGSGTRQGSQESTLVQQARSPSFYLHPTCRPHPPWAWMPSGMTAMLISDHGEDSGRTTEVG